MISVSRLNILITLYISYVSSYQEDSVTPLSLFGVVGEDSGWSAESTLSASENNIEFETDPVPVIMRKPLFGSHIPINYKIIEVQSKTSSETTTDLSESVLNSTPMKLADKNTLLDCANSTDGLAKSQFGSQWMEWEKWSECSDSCGGCGTHSRRRQCLSNHPNCTCQGPTVETEKCNFNFCIYPRDTCCNGLRAKSKDGKFACL